MLRLRICYLLYQERKAVVQVGDFTEVVSIDRISDVGGESSSEGIVDLNSDIINSWLWVFVEVLINPDGVGELDGW